MIMAIILHEILAPLMMIAYIALFVYIILLLGRFVRAAEKIANKIENSPKI